MTEHDEALIDDLGHRFWRAWDEAPPDLGVPDGEGEDDRAAMRVVLDRLVELGWKPADETQQCPSHLGNLAPHARCERQAGHPSPHRAGDSAWPCEGPR